MGGRGRAHSRQDRADVLKAIDEAVEAGATRTQACTLLGLSTRTVQRWRHDPEGEDARRGPKTPPAHALSEQEREQIVAVATSPEFCEVSPQQIVCRLADRGVYLASESSFYRVLHACKLQTHRQPCRAPVSREKPVLCATAPGEVWVWDISCLPTMVKGRFFYLYWVMDLYSRYIVGWAIHAEESAEHASRLIQTAVLEQGVDPAKLVLHADNGAPMKGSTLKATLERLQIASSFSRPGVSNDNAHCESSFRTLKYRPGYPKRLETVAAWEGWVTDFLHWYHIEHHHSGIGLVTPQVRHLGEEEAVLAQRREVYEQARLRHPKRWSKGTRPWAPAGPVNLTPSNQPAT